LPSEIKAVNGCPKTAQTIANAIPVLPLVASTTGWLSKRSPLFLAFSIIVLAILSFFE
jgi:uncharacterized membrane protein